MNTSHFAWVLGREQQGGELSLVAQLGQKHGGEHADQTLDVHR
jgi:hypothetical protein